MNYLVLFSLLATAAFGSEFDVYRDVFEREYAKRRQYVDLAANPLPRVPIAFRKQIDGDIAAQCQLWNDGTREIVVDRKDWLRMTESDREQLMLHELAHCVLDIGAHRDLEVRGMPVSLMHARMIPQKFYLRFRDKYLDELFALPNTKEKMGE